MKLFEKCKIGSMELKNRLVMAPMSCNLNEEGCLVTIISSNGAASVITGCCMSR